MNLSLTDELRAFLDANCGDGTLFATPSEYVRALIREKKDRQEAAALRRAVIEGYEDVLHGRTVLYRGSIEALLSAHRKKKRA
ncbi:MAG: hypothetical protein IPK26_18440 [Planctomycetes bacterium]|nr:hypothetical protein [Planctomycetota bacterium]